MVMTRLLSKTPAFSAPPPVDENGGGKGGRGGGKGREEKKGRESLRIPTYGIPRRSSLAETLLFCVTRYYYNRFNS
jgi:hypothetical protein